MEVDSHGIPTMKFIHKLFQINYYYTNILGYNSSHFLTKLIGFVAKLAPRTSSKEMLVGVASCTH